MSGDLPEKTLFTLWGRAGGICEICGHPLSYDTFTKKLKHRGYAAHIYGEKPNSARYHPVESPKLKKEISNLMLLCDSCHKRIDIDEPENYTVSTLIKFKAEHEKFIEMIVSCKNKRETQAIACCSKIGTFCPPAFDNNMLIEAILGNSKRPASVEPISLLNTQDGIDDSDPLYWEWHKNNLKLKYQQFSAIHAAVKHLSIFAIAPQPILILLGSLISEIIDVDVYQKHRNGTTWIWPNKKANEVNFKTIEPAEKNKTNVVINFSLSGNIQNEKIIEALGEDTAVWTFTVDNPSKHFVNSPKIQELFKAELANLLNAIKAANVNTSAINIFPAMPASLAVETGRVRMQKADLPFILYDYNNKTNGFIKAFDIG